MKTVKKFYIRPATANDSEIIAQLSVICWQHAYKNIFDNAYLDSLQWQTRAAGRNKFYVENTNAAGFIVEVDEHAVGFCDTGPARLVEKLPLITNNYGEIYALYLLPEYQKQGIGAALCQTACEYLISKGYAHCIIWTLVENTQAIEFYKAIGCTQQYWYKDKIINDQAQKEIAFTLDLL